MGLQCKEMKHQEEPKVYATNLKHFNLFSTGELISRLDMAKGRSTHVAETIETSGTIQTEKGILKMRQNMSEL